MIPMLKPLIIQSLARVGLRVHRIPRQNYRINPAVKDLGTDEILQIVQEVTSKSPEERPSWPASKQYLGPRRFSSYCDVVDLLDRHGVPIDGRRVIDIGTLFGILLRDLGRRHPTAKLYGAECLPTCLAAARRVCRAADIRPETIETLSFDELFDVVVLMEVLEHLVDPDGELARLDALIAPGGTLLVTVPNGRYDVTGAQQFEPERKSYVGHINFWSPESWPLFLQRALPERSIVTGLHPPAGLFALIRKA